MSVSTHNHSDNIVTVVVAFPPFDVVSVSSSSEKSACPSANGVHQLQRCLGVRVVSIRHRWLIVVKANLSCGLTQHKCILMYVCVCRKNTKNQIIQTYKANTHFSPKFVYCILIVVFVLIVALLVRPLFVFILIVAFLLF